MRMILSKFVVAALPANSLCERLVAQNYSPYLPASQRTICHSPHGARPAHHHPHVLEGKSLGQMKMTQIYFTFSQNYTDNSERDNNAYDGASR